MTAPPAEIPGLVSLVGVDPALARLLQSRLCPMLTVKTLDDQNSLFLHMEGGGLPVDAVVLGMALEEPVRVAQHIHVHDKHIPILILSRPADCDQLKRTLMFSPFLGNEVTPWSTDEPDGLPATLRQAAERRRLRVRNQNVLSSAHIRLEKLPLLQPDASHYLDQLLDHAPIGVVTVDPAGAILTLNRQAQDTLRVAERGALGRLLGDLFPLAERQRLYALLSRCTSHGPRPAPEVFEFHSADGTPRFVETGCTPLTYRTGQRGIMLIMQDVTDRIRAERERCRAEEDLRLHATVLRAFHEISSDRSLTLEEKLNHLLKLGCEQFGLPIGILSQVNGDMIRVLDSVGGKGRFPVGGTRELGQTYCGGTVHSSEPVALEHAAASEWRDHPSYTRGGLEAYIGVRVQVENDLYGTLCFASPSPRPRPFSSADREILKLMSQWVGSELRRERADAHMRKLSGALEQAVDAVIITDRERFIEYVNPAFETLTGYRKEEAIGKKTYFLRSGLHDDRFYRELWQVIGTGGVYRGVLVNRKKDGSLYHEMKTISPLKDDQGRVTHYISTGHDITERVRAEERDRLHRAELAHVARLSTLGEMASGLAHELNQPLCAITTYAQTALRVLTDPDGSAERARYGLEQVVRQAELAGGIFRRLRHFARKGDMNRRRVCLKEVIQEVAGFIQADARQSGVRVELAVARNLPRVLADPIQIEQVLLNLARNAMDAMAGVEKPRRQLLIKARRQGRRGVRMEIHDCGRGCPQEVADRLFEPFFTTKPDGLGVGLGISQSIIEAHNGRLWLDDNSDQGATFCFTLPGDEDQAHATSSCD
ncbi:MAG: PAS domain S-box protein [Thiobacillus sp.]|nr:PAS domain S-box protein [Thiobacillus sp.]